MHQCQLPSMLDVKHGGVDMHECVGGADGERNGPCSRCIGAALQPYGHNTVILDPGVRLCFSYKLLRPSVAVLHATDRVMGPEGNVCLAGCVSVGPHVQAGVAGVCVFSINTVLKHCA